MTQDYWENLYQLVSVRCFVCSACVRARPYTFISINDEAKWAKVCSLRSTLVNYRSQYIDSKLNAIDCTSSMKNDLNVSLLAIADLEQPFYSVQ